jgi:hypothetical protein
MKKISFLLPMSLSYCLAKPQLLVTGKVIDATNGQPLGAAFTRQKGSRE